MIEKLKHDCLSYLVFNITRAKLKIYKYDFLKIIMAEKRNEKKLLVLLVVIVALSLVVDLLSLNVLYSIAGAMQRGEGELAVVWWDPTTWGPSGWEPEKSGTYYESQTESMDPENARVPEEYCSDGKIWEDYPGSDLMIEDCGEKGLECKEDSGDAWCEEAQTPNPYHNRVNP